jgi:hypothetical protein
VNKEVCFENAYNTFKDCKWTIVCDRLNDDTKTFLEKFNLELTHVDIGNNAGSFNYVLDKVLELDNKEIVYLLEDDYLHKPNSKQIITDGIELGFDYVTLYDHPDKYMNPIDGGNPFCSGMSEETRVYLGDNCHWKLTNSTTMTFASKVKTLREDEKIIRKWTSEKHPNDFQMFIELKQNFRRLASPIPGYSTHCETRWLTPLKNWNEEVSNIYN